MAFTFGFYNALNHDRRYNAIQVSSIFDGIIKDGIFMSIGGHMNVKATGNGFNIVVESGRAWFNHTWSLLDADYPMVVEPSDVLEDRIDVVVLEVNENVDVRLNSIKIIKGEPAEHPTKPALTNNLDIHQYALAYITVPANSVTLTQSNVENAIGLGSTPFVTGILETINIDDLVAQWKSQWSDWTEEVDLNWNNWFDTVDNAWTTWFTQQQSKWEDILTERTEEWEEIKDTIDSEWASQQGSINSDYTNWKSSALAAYNQWLDQIKGTLDDDAATQLAKEVVELKNRDDVISTYQHVKSGTEHMFIGSGSNGKVKMTADIASGDKVVVSSAPKSKVTVQGETSQPGTGDPSPNNIRMIDGVGMYDKMVVLDGSENFNYNWYTVSPGVPPYLVTRGGDAPFAQNSGEFSKSNRFIYHSVGGSRNYNVYAIGWDNINGSYINIRLSDELVSEQSIDGYKTYLQSHPLIIFYKSVNYTPEADIAVALEKRVNGYAVFDGEEPITTDSTGSMVLFSVPLPNPSSRANDDPDSVISSHYPYKNVSSDNTLDGGVRLAMGSDSLIIRDSNNFGTSEELSSLLSDQYDLGTPVQVVYELASAAT